MLNGLAARLASIQEFMTKMSRCLDQIESSRQDHQPVGINTVETIPHASHIAQVLPFGTSYDIPFHLLDHCDIAPPPVAIVFPPIIPTTDDTRLVE